MFGALALLLIAQRPDAIAARPEELTEARAFALAKFGGSTEGPASRSGIQVLANNDPVQPNARGGRSMNIAGREFTRGLYCHAVSHLVVSLPGPARELSAVVGVDSNDQTRPGRGSVIFVVRAGGAEQYRSELMREGMAGVEVTAPLNGATELELLVEDGGDGIACDQADWADARCLLEDGTTVWLGDLPIGVRPPYSPEPPFSFLYAGSPVRDRLGGWSVSRARVEDAARARVEHRALYADPLSGLRVEMRAVEYTRYPTVEWTAYLRNEGDSDTPLIEDLQAIDLPLYRSGDQPAVLHHWRGTTVTASDFEPLATTLKPGTELRFTPPGGRPCGVVWPYFNLEEQGRGTIVVVGWPGQWAATFTADNGPEVRLRAGQERTRFVLHPGEEVRTPLIVLQFYTGDLVRSQNVWRRWMREHSMPTRAGEPIGPQLAACSSHQFGEMIHANEENQKLFVDRYLDEGIKLDYWWMDAGWYINETGWPNTGTWEVDKGRFPNGLRAITDHAHAKGVNSLVWFEPERVTPGTWLYENHPEWLLGRDVEQKLLNLGDPEARAWLTDHVDRIMTDEGIDLYRQDYNIDPLGFWRAADTENREGMVENAYVTGYLAYWDELHRRRPGLVIDTCASGGHRNDLETMRRAMPLLRSDYIIEPVGQQGHTYGLSSWFPFYGTGTGRSDAYAFRSTMCPHFTACYDMRERGLPYEQLRTLFTEWREVTPYMLGDFYPLTPYSIAGDVWIAWQFDRPDLSAGMVEAFRRADSPYETARFRLSAMDPDATYEVHDLDSPDVLRMTGRQLMEDGLVVTMDEQPGAKVIVYRIEGTQP